MKYKKTQKKCSGKKLCVFLLILFTLVLAADIANLFITPAQNQIAFAPGGFEQGDSSGFPMPEGGFQRPANGVTPSDDFSMPDGDFQMPAEAGEGRPGGDFQVPEGGFGNGEAPEGMEEMPGFAGGSFEGRGGRPSGFLQRVRSAWLPIAAVCILADAVCLILLRRTRRREKAKAEAFAGVPNMPLLEEEEEDSGEPPRRKRGPWTAILCLVIAFAMILAMIPTGDTDSSSANVHQEVLSGTAGEAQIHTVLSGAGTLEADTLTPVTVPQQVTVLKYHVRNGETVTAGDALVSVDKTSASSAMMDLSDVLKDLDKDLETERQARNSNAIVSTAAGRVKKIYAREGDTVTDVLYTHGALMLLSLDGTMKVTFASSESVTVGEEVTVQYSSTSEAGRIASVREGRVTVTLSDEKAVYGAQATILDESGTVLGEGKMEITSALKVIGYYGTVDDISVDVGDKIRVGTTLMTLENTGDTTDYQILLARRNELEVQMQKLSQLAQTGMVYAENDGIVSGVPDDAQIELLSGSAAAKTNLLSSANGGWQLILLSNVTPKETDQTVAQGEEEGLVPTLEDLGSDTGDGALEEGFENGDSGSGGSGNTDAEEDSADNNSSGNGDSGNDGSESADSGDDGSGNDGSGNDGSGGEGPISRNGNYAASLVSASGGKLYVWLCPTAITADAATLDLTKLPWQMTQFGEYAYADMDNADISLTANNAVFLVKLSDLKQNDLLLLNFSDGAVTKILKAQRPADQASDPAQDGQEMPSGGSGGFSGGMPSSGGVTAQKSYEQYVVEETRLLYVSDQQEIAVTISVDELDILSMERGLEAKVTLDAMKGQSFTGSIARISREGTNDGGNTKFTVTVILPREARMLDGMNASVKVVTATSQVSVSIPAAALVEDDGKTYVYTTYDEKTDTLAGLSEVETGASDGELVEILSGLEVGDTFYYRYADTVTYSFLTNV